MASLWPVLVFAASTAYAQTAIEGYIIAADKFLKDYVLTPKGRAIAEKAFKKAFGGQ